MGEHYTICYDNLNAKKQLIQQRYGTLISQAIGIFAITGGTQTMSLILENTASFDPAIFLRDLSICSILVLGAQQKFLLSKRYRPEKDGTVGKMYLNKNDMFKLSIAFIRNIKGNRKLSKELVNVEDLTRGVLSRIPFLNFINVQLRYPRYDITVDIIDVKILPDKEKLS